MSVETNETLNRIDGYEHDDHLASLPIMSKAELKKVALEHGGYSTPSLNDTLYLHFKGYRRIENLEEYAGLKSLWLHSNGFSQIENVNSLKELRCLFLQNNAFTKIENLDGLSSLVQLDLSENNIACVEGLSHLACLKTLNLSKNLLKDAESIRHLTECNELSAIDLSKNQLSGEDVIDCLAGIVNVTSINMAGNPVVSKVAYFRKKMIVGCKLLRYLDRPIFEDERASTEAWAKGGPDAERETKERLQQGKKDKERNSLVEFRAWQESVRRSRSLPQDKVDATIPPPLVITNNVQSAVNEDIDSDDEMVPPPLVMESHSVDVAEKEDIVSVDEIVPLPSVMETSPSDVPSPEYEDIIAAVDDMIPPALEIEYYSDGVQTDANEDSASVDGLDVQTGVQSVDEALEDGQNADECVELLEQKCSIGTSETGTHTSDGAIATPTSDAPNETQSVLEKSKNDNDNCNMCSLS
ncbi:hypothetical protein ACHAWU_008013 [Discostella pseudostelligera]|uniref:Dynein assembly factor 1, axonemal homolog n=1 Tax=Discostella pseudostelligera TaxID=259834 RepID=A0ABD3M305_9STRA